MTDEQFKNFKEESKIHMEAVIQKTVNGKIDTLTKETRAFITRATPVVSLFENISWLKKILISGLISIASIAVGAQAIVDIFFKNHK